MNNAVTTPEICGDNLKGRLIFRCRNAGVHVAELIKIENGLVFVKNDNRLFQWRGAHDLSYVAKFGVDRETFTKISTPLPLNTFVLDDVCEMIPVAEGVDLSECGIVNKPWK